MKKQEKNQQNVELIISRLLSALKIGSIKELASELGTTTGAISNWKSRGPAYHTVVTKCLEKGISVDYVFGLDEGTTPNDPIVNDDGEIYVKQSHIEQLYVKRINEIEKKLRLMQKELKNKCE